jgi:hypothetical protein
MIRTLKIHALLVAFATNTLAGTLDSTPFRLALPNSDWKLDDAKMQSVSNGVYLVAYAGNDKTQLRTVIIKTELESGPASTLDGFATWIRTPLTNHQILVTETNTTFVGQPARQFKYEMKAGKDLLYTETTIFITGTNGWTVAAIGPANQQDEIKQIWNFYQQK